MNKPIFKIEYNGTIFYFDEDEAKQCLLDHLTERDTIHRNPTLKVAWEKYQKIKSLVS